VRAKLAKAEMDNGELKGIKEERYKSAKAATFGNGLAVVAAGPSVTVNSSIAGVKRSFPDGFSGVENRKHYLFRLGGSGA